MIIFLSNKFVVSYVVDIDEAGKQRLKCRDHGMGQTGSP